MRRLCLLCLFFAAASFLTAQSPPTACTGNMPSPAAFCSQACILCDIDGYVGTNNPWPQWEAPPDFCAPQFHNINWLGFIAGTSSIIIEISTFNCLNGNGLQAQIYRTVDCTSWQAVSNCDPGFNNTTLTAYGLQPGETYFLVIDGNVADICEFAIDVVSGSATAPDVAGVPAINGPASLCSGGTTTYTAANVFGAAAYTWSLNGAIIGYEQYISVGNLPAGAYELCVEPSNPCYGPGESSCRTINVGPLPLMSLDEEVCTEELPFTYQGFSFTATGSYSFSFIRPDGCEQPVLLNLTVLPPNPPTDIAADICQGELYSIGAQVFANSGNYTIAMQDQNGCDSVINLQLAVHPPSFTSLGVVAAELPYQVGATTIDTSGDFVVVLTDRNGCDSIVLGFLAAIGPDTLFTDTTICQGDTVFYNMDTLTSSGLYLDTLINADTATIQQLALTVLPAQDTTLDVSLCQGEEVIIGGVAYDSTGQYRDTLPAANGCDSLITLNLTVLQPVDTIRATICEGESYVLGNTTYTQAGNYNTVLTSPSGCQSMVQLQLTINLIVEAMLVEVRCEGDSLIVGSSAYSSTGAYSDTLLAASGCDSIVQTTLTILPTGRDTLAASICEGNPFNFAGANYTRSGLYCDTIPGGGANGCDSILCLNLTVWPNDTTVLDTAICEGESIAIGTSMYTASGQYTNILTGANGCDSIILLTLAVLPVQETIINQEICEGDSFIIGGTTYNQPGQYAALLTAANGCDSLITLILDVLPVEETLLEERICEGDTYNIGGQVLTSPGMYQIVLPNPQTGCDSIVTVELEILPPGFNQASANICEGETYPFDSMELSQPGQYTAVFSSIAGCDSVVTLTLSVTPVVETALDTTLCPNAALYIGPYVFREPFEGELQFTGANGCDSILHLGLTYRDTIRLDSFHIEPDAQDFFGGSIYVELTGGTPPYSYLWSDGRTEPFIDFLPRGKYFLTAADAYCSRVFVFKVPYEDEFSTGPVILRPGSGGGGITVSPNPFGRELEVRLSGVVEDQPVHLRMYDLTGQVVHEEMALGVRHRLQPQVPAGVYWLEGLQDGKRIGVEKVVSLR